MTVGRDLLTLKNQLAVRFSQMAYNGFWYCEEMDALNAFLTSSQQHVTGRVTLELYQGNIIVTGRESDHSLYDEMIASMDDDGGAYDSPTPLHPPAGPAAASRQAPAAPGAGHQANTQEGHA